MKLTVNSKALVITLFFRLLFGGYIVGVDQYRFNDIDSALSVLLIYLLIGIFASLFLCGKSYGLKALLGLEVIFIALNSIFIIMTLGQVTDAGLHAPIANWWATLFRYLFSLLTLLFSIRVYRETYSPEYADI